MVIPDGKFFLLNGRTTQKSQSCVVKLNNEKSPHEFGSGSDAVDDEQARHYFLTFELRRFAGQRVSALYLHSMLISRRSANMR